VVLYTYGCGTWSVTLREERRLRVLRGMFGPKKDEVTGDRLERILTMVYVVQNSQNFSGLFQSSGI
jgi:hypothetical protein